MKKSTQLTLCLLLVCLTVGAQVGYLESKTYFKLGMSAPVSNYFGRDKANFEYRSKKGVALEGGRIFMLHGIRPADGLRFGLDATYIGLFYHSLKPDFEPQNSIDYVDIVEYETIGVREGSIFLYSKFGPSISYSPVQGLVFDAFFKANMHWLGLSYFADEEFSASDTEMFGGYLGLGYSTGINIRYKLLLLSFEMNSVKIKMESADYAGQYLGDIDNPTALKTPLPYFNITFGLNY